MKKKYIPVVRYNPHKWIFKWEYDYEVEYIYEDDDKYPPRAPMVKAADNLFGPSARLTKSWAVRAAKREVREVQEFWEQRNREWEEV